MKLYSYQKDLDHRIDKAWRDGATNVLATLATGGGKTVLFANKLNKEKGASIAIAHRKELVSQISLSLAKFGLKHRIIASRSTIKWIVNLHLTTLGKSFYDPNAKCGVASVDLLLNRKSKLDSWFKQVKLWVCDEAHHLQRNNKWGKATMLFPNARGLGVTATPGRTDGCGLGSHNDGVFDELILGPGPRELINMGFLTDYIIYGPKTRNLDMSGVPITASGDYSPGKMVSQVRKSCIVGDVVYNYLKFAYGLLGVTFVPDVETAKDIAQEFNDKGVKATYITAKTPEKERFDAIKKLRNRELLQIVNVDIFGEGFDLPAIEVVSLARPSESRNLVDQQVGRGLRVMEGKPRAIIIDHVDNIRGRHGPPDGFRDWSLDRREKKKSKSGPPCKTCPECTGVYYIHKKCCPYCGHYPVPVSRSGPEFVDGDLEELDSSVLAALRGEVNKVNEPFDEQKYRRMGFTDAAILGRMRKNHYAKQQAQKELIDAIALWAGYQRQNEYSDSESYRIFYHRYGIDVLSAQSLKASDSAKLKEKIERDLCKM